MEDKLLVLISKRGDTDAMRSIYIKYRDHLLILGIALLNDVHAAEDLLQDVFVSFVENLQCFNLTGSLKSYLSTCLANRARNFARSRARRQNHSLEHTTDTTDLMDSPAQSLICNEQLSRLSAALSQLPTEQREVIVLHIYSGMKLRIIAKSTGLSANTVKSRYRYGVEKLRLLLNSEVEK
jgi:RNA polymerase sigma factor (sigma-70 family)